MEVILFTVFLAISLCANRYGLEFDDREKDYCSKRPPKVSCPGQQISWYESDDYICVEKPIRTTCLEFGECMSLNTLLEKEVGVDTELTISKFNETVVEYYVMYKVLFQYVMLGQYIGSSVNAQFFARLEGEDRDTFVCGEDSLIHNEEVRFGVCETSLFDRKEALGIRECLDNFMVIYESCESDGFFKVYSDVTFLLHPLFTGLGGIAGNHILVIIVYLFIIFPAICYFCFLQYYERMNPEEIVKVNIPPPTLAIENADEKQKEIMRELENMTSESEENDSDENEKTDEDDIMKEEHLSEQLKELRRFIAMSKIIMNKNEGNDLFCFCHCCRQMIEIFKSFVLVVCSVFRNSFAIWASLSVFAIPVPTNLSVYVYFSMNSLSNDIIFYSYVFGVIAFLNFVLMSIWIRQWYVNPFVTSMIILLYKEWLIHRFLQVMINIYIINQHVVILCIQYMYSMFVVRNDLQSFIFVVTQIAFPFVVLIFSSISHLSYNGVGGIEYYRRLKKFKLKPSEFPNIRIPLYKCLFHSPNEIVSDPIFLLCVIRTEFLKILEDKDEDEDCSNRLRGILQDLEKRSEYSHYSTVWRVLRKLEISQIRFLINFFFEGDISEKVKESVVFRETFMYHPPLQIQWMKNYLPICFCVCCCYCCCRTQFYRFRGDLKKVEEVAELEFKESKRSSKTVGEDNNTETGWEKREKEEDVTSNNTENHKDPDVELEDDNSAMVEN